MDNANLELLVAGGEHIHEATMVAVNADGYAVPASAKEGLTVAGCALRDTDNSADEDGAVKVPVRRGAFVWDNDGTIKGTDILKDAYVKDETTVTITSDGSSRAGRILAVDADGVTVDMV
jgi:hypothetical protein